MSTDRIKSQRELKRGTETEEVWEALLDLSLRLDDIEQGLQSGMRRVLHDLNELSKRTS